ncbi:hypothetical protein [Micromonospora sagamiensis]|uniref:Cysteine dioxygenase type I n=1 Tax=Micromonospora sagamiensis TaxID=47875 RepID=A0A562WEI8_9ACTN|nr:hypothetical protein [Micromonospora sagamiensis]TWJ28636.1 hypothetical protein JD81_02141 [Micromonospora sagamiensis]BCL12459.1 hypothetical protein GCM10017556_01980 [Micromonospora sagamiensis]
MMSYADLEREIDRGTRPELLRDWVLDVLDDVAGRRRPLLAVRHPLGFTCLPVNRTGRDGICVHAWPAEPPAVQPTTSTMHSHSWDLLSHVLHGRIRNELIEVTEAPADPAWRVYEVHSRGDVDEMAATDRLVTAAPATVETHSAGNSYALRAGGFHTSEVDPGQPAVTVVLGRATPGLCDLSLGAVDGCSHRVRRDRCDAAETARMAREIARLVARG